MGSAAFSGAYRGAFIVLGIAALLSVVGLVFKERIQAFMAKFLHRPPKDGSEL